MRKIIVIILVLIGFSAYSQTPPRTGYLVQTAKWKFVNPIWLDSGAYITKIPKYGGQNRYLVYDSLTGKIGYRYVSATGNYVPYTGATADVDLGVYIMNAASFHAKGTGGTGHVGFKHQSSSATAAGSETVIFANSTGYLYSKNDGNPIEKIIGSNDTSSMLSKYLRSADTLKLSNRINLKQNTLSLTTTGTSGAATLVGATLNIPQYSGTTYTGGNGIIVGGSTIYRDSIKSTGQYGNAWGNRMYLGGSNNRSVRFRTNGVERAKLDSNGTFTLNTLPVLTSNYGLLNLGSGAFDGSTSGFFTGAAAGTLIACNLASGSTSDFINLQKGGQYFLKVINSGRGYLANGLTVDDGGLTVSNGTINAANGFFNGSGNKLDHFYAGGNMNLTSGVHQIFDANPTINPTSGTATHIGLYYDPIINQTGSANGIIRGIYINPTITAVAVPFRAIEITRGVVLMATYTFATLPTGAPTGSEVNISDSNTTTWGATIAGGGANNVKARYNGTNWTVIGI